MDDNRMREKWMGITYPVPVFLQKDWFWDLWKRLMCPHGWHLLDEVQSIDDHYLLCDACEIEIHIDSSKAEKIDEETWKTRVATNRQFIENIGLRVDGFKTIEI